MGMKMVRVRVLMLMVTMQQAYCELFWGFGLGFGLGIVGALVAISSFSVSVWCRVQKAALEGWGGVGFLKWRRALEEGQSTGGDGVAKERALASPLPPSLFCANQRTAKRESRKIVDSVSIAAGLLLMQTRCRGRTAAAP